jgi:hypothetical protein
MIADFVYGTKPDLRPLVDEASPPPAHLVPRPRQVIEMILPSVNGTCACKSNGSKGASSG